MTRLVDLDEVSSPDLYHLAAARREQEMEEGARVAAGMAERLDWVALRVWLSAGHQDKFVGVVDRPALGAYRLVRTAA